MSIQVNPHNESTVNERNQPTHKLAPPNDSVESFNFFMSPTNMGADWRTWPGYKPDFNTFQDQVEVVETDTTIEAKIADKPVSNDQRGTLDEFLNWFKKGVEDLSKSKGKTFAILQAGMVAQTIFSSLAMANRMVAEVSNASKNVSELPLQTREALSASASEGPQALAKKVQQILEETSVDAPAIAGAAMQEALKANPQTAPQAIQTIIQAASATNPVATAQIASAVAEVAAVAANPEAAPQIAASVTSAVAQANPEAASQIAASVTSAAVQVNPEAASQIAASVTSAVVQVNPEAASQIAASVTSAAVQANPEAALQIVASVVNAAVQATPEAALQVANEVTKAAIEAGPQGAAQIAMAVAAVTVQSSADETPQSVGGVVQSESSNTPGDEPSLSTPVKASQAAAAAVASAMGSGTPPISTGNVSLESAPAPATTSGLDSRLNNLLADIVKTVKEMNIGETSTTISFNDATLRDVTVEISLNNGRLEVAFTTSDSASQALLQNNMAALQSALQAGSGISSVSVTVAGDSEMEVAPDSKEGVGEGGESKSEKTGSSSDKKVSGQGGASES